jgi:hypothetical protein
MEDKYYQKYLKYKQKYLELKGGFPIAAAAAISSLNRPTYKSSSTSSSSYNTSVNCDCYRIFLEDEYLIVYKLIIGMNEYEKIHNGISMDKYIKLYNNAMRLIYTEPIEINENLYILKYILSNNNKIFNNLKKKLIDIIINSTELNDLFSKKINQYLSKSDITEENLNLLLNLVSNTLVLLTNYNFVSNTKKRMMYWQDGNYEKDKLYITEKGVEYVKVGTFSDNTYNINIDYKNIPEHNPDTSSLKMEIMNSKEFQNYITKINNIIKKYYGEKIVELLKNNTLIKDKKIKITNFYLI